MQIGDKGLNQAQAKAVALNKGPALVVAGAGTGKTRVIVERITRLLNEGISPKRILALTFTEKAAAEMLDRVTELSGSYQLNLPIMTFNAYGESLLRRYAADIGLARNFTLMGDSAQVVFLRERIDELKLDYFAPISRPDGLLGDIADYFSHLKQNVITPDQYTAFTVKMPSSDPAEKLQKTKHQELAQAYETYIRLCRESDVIDYDDQIYLLIELLRLRPNIQAEIQATYDYVMVDEFQDTNTMQSVLVDMIVGDKQNLMVVGDDDQSIYGWRGATLANILDFKKRYPKAADVTLLQNYRSSQTILDSAYALIQHNNPDRLEERLGINKRLLSERAGNPPQVYSFATLDEELQWIAGDIKQRIAAGTAPSLIAILARRNATVQLLHSYLDFEEVEHVIAGQRYELYQEPIVRAMLEGIKAVADPTDSLSLYHTLTGPLFNLPSADLSKWAGEARRQQQTLQDYLEAIEENIELTDALSLLQTWRDQMGSTTVGQLAFEMLDSSGYKDRLYALAGEDAVSAVAVNRLSELFKTMKEFEQVALQPSAIQYVEALPALQAAGDSNEDGSLDLSGQVVNVLTIHKSKGLEWPIVYIADCTEGSFPLRENSRGLSLPEGLVASTEEGADSHIAEERRLMYVAMTRAKDELILSYAERHSSASVRKPSRFLLEAFDAMEHTKQLGESPAATKSLGRFAPTVPPAVPLPSRMRQGDTISLTVSQAQKYMDCPLDFYYCYVLNVPQESSIALAYGSLMHDLIEMMNRSLMAGDPIDLPALQEHFEQAWPRVGYLSPGHQERAKKQAEATLKQLYKRTVEQKRVPLAVEEAFTISLPDCNLTINGRFDAVFPLGNGVEIVDYKTSTSVDTADKAKQRATASQQLTLYALAWQLMHDELPVQVTLDFVDTALQGSVKKTQRGIDGAKNRLTAVADRIRNMDFTPGKDHLFCIHPPI